MALKIATALRLAAGGLAALPSSLAAADEERATFRIITENDNYELFNSDTDRYYTNGIRFEYERKTTADGPFLPGVEHQAWCSLLCGEQQSDMAYVTGGSLGQNMYTPERITEPRNQPHDRPWGGLLYVSRYATASRRESPGRERQDRVEATIGIVGPASLAGPVQRELHSWFESWDQPAGWHNQLRNEPVVQLQYSTARRWEIGQGNRFDFIPRVRGNLGNALISVEAEGTLRLGWNLQGFGAPTPQPAPAPAFAPAGEAPRVSPVRSQPDRSGYFNLFLRGNLKAVAHNIFLDGNTFARNDIRIARKPLVPELAAGFEARFVRAVTVTYQYVRRFSEFRSRPFGNAPAQNFGSITVAFHW